MGHSCFKQPFIARNFGAADFFKLALRSARVLTSKRKRFWRD